MKGSKKMEENMSIFDLLPEEEAEKYRPMKSDDWKWTFADYPKEKNGLKVFSCFACGGGSTMGYKLAGCEVIGCCEIDPRMNEIYVKNHHPRYNFLMDIRDFNAIPNEELPEELFNLDVLDGSPPCTTFSMAGIREKSWGKEKKFREGQKKQTLDDLSFVFIETVKKLKPRVVVMENMEGLILGEAFSYVQKIYRQFDEAGYVVHHWLMKGEVMGIPQARHRVIFTACRKDTGIDPSKLNMAFNYEKVYFGQMREEHGTYRQTEYQERLEKYFQYGDKCIDDINQRIGKNGGFSNAIIYDDQVCPTIVANSQNFRAYDKLALTDNDVLTAQTFPQDYDFQNEKVQYVCGMSVPPVMMKRIMQRLISEGVFSYKGVH